MGDQFVLNGTTLAAITGLLGALVGGISFLFRALLSAKDEQIVSRNEQINILLRDRDYWRDLSVSLMGGTERAISIAEEATRRTRWPP